MNDYRIILRAMGRRELPAPVTLRSSLQAKPGHLVVGRTDTSAIVIGSHHHG